MGLRVCSVARFESYGPSFRAFTLVKAGIADFSADRAEPEYCCSHASAVISELKLLWLLLPAVAPSPCAAVIGESVMLVSRGHAIRRGMPTVDDRKQ